MRRVQGLSEWWSEDVWGQANESLWWFILFAWIGIGGLVYLACTASLLTSKQRKARRAQRGTSRGCIGWAVMPVWIPLWIALAYIAVPLWPLTLWVTRNLRISNVVLAEDAESPEMARLEPAIRKAVGLAGVNGDSRQLGLRLLPWLAAGETVVAMFPNESGHSPAWLTEHALIFPNLDPAKSSPRQKGGLRLELDRIEAVSRHGYQIRVVTHDGLVVTHVTGQVQTYLDPHSPRYLERPDQAALDQATRMEQTLNSALEARRHAGRSTVSRPEVATGGQAPGWYDDPAGRFELRYWDGTGWTSNVARNGVQSLDPPTA